jgi:hypothetical protein
VVFRTHRHGKVDELGTHGRADAHAPIANFRSAGDRDAAGGAERHGIAERRRADRRDAVAILHVDRKLYLRRERRLRGAFDEGETGARTERQGRDAAALRRNRGIDGRSG